MYYDITFNINTHLPVWPGSKGFQKQWELTIPDAVNNSSSFQQDTHYGTHIDAPLHFVQNGKSVEELDLEKMIGSAIVAEIRGTKDITKAHLEAIDIPLGVKKLLLKTDNQELWAAGKGFDEHFCSIDQGAAEWLAEREFDLIGIDYLSIQRYHHGPETHQILLQSEVVILECLDLSGVSPGQYELICLPMKLAGLEGAPARAILKT